MHLAYVTNNVLIIKKKRKKKLKLQNHSKNHYIYMTTLQILNTNYAKNNELKKA